MADQRRDLRERIENLEASLRRMDELDADDVDPDEYQATLQELVELREKRDHERL